MGMKARATTGVTIYHNPNCTTSKYALAVAEQLRIPYREVRYLRDKPDRATLEHLVSILQDPVEDLVRKDANFRRLGLDPESFAGSPEAVVEILVDNIALLQRPVIVRGDSAIIGRPKDRVAPFLS